MLPISEVHVHHDDPVVAYSDLLVTTNPNQTLLAMCSGMARTVINFSMLMITLKIMLDALQLDNTLYSSHRLRRVGVTSAY